MDQKSNIRQSNFELLRIVCMYNILLYHLLFHGCNGLQLIPSVSKASVVVEAFLSCVGHDTNLTGSNPVAGIYRQAKRMASR